MDKGKFERIDNAAQLHKIREKIFSIAEENLGELVAVDVRQSTLDSIFDDIDANIFTPMDLNVQDRLNSI